MKYLKLFRTLLLSGALMSMIEAATQRGDIVIAYYGKTIDELITNYMKKNNVPCMTLAIVQAPYITREGVWGISDRETKQLAASNTVFCIGQMTNAYTAVAIMQLVEEGKITLDDLISEYIDDLPQEWAAITIRDLVTHCSGLPNYTDAKGFDYSNEYTPSQIKALAKGQLLFEPGTNASYSATNYYLLGLIIEQASGMSYQDYVTKNQIDRIGLKYTFFISNKDIIKNEVKNATKSFKHSQFLHDPVLINPTELATGYVQDGQNLVPSKKSTWSATFADSGIIASSSDISQWDIALAGDILVKDPKNRAFLYNPITLKNGQVIPGNANWVFPGHKGLLEIKGSIPGYSSFLSRFTIPTELLCVTLLANKDNLSDLDILARQIAGAFESSLAAPRASAWSVSMQSPYSVDKTIDRVKQFVLAHGGTIFAHINHAQEAEKVNLKLQPTQVLILGNPAQGTALMQVNPQIALDLPLKIMATQNNDGNVWLSFTDPVVLAKEYGDEDPKHREHLTKIHNALLKASQTAVSPYTTIAPKGVAQ